MRQETTVINAENIFGYSQAFFISDYNIGSEISWKWPTEIGPGLIFRIKLSPGLAQGFGEFKLFDDIELHIEPSLLPVVFHFVESLHGNYG